MARIEETNLALGEVGVTSDEKKSVEPSQSVLDARKNLIAGLHKLGQSQDIDGILEVERALLAAERKYLATEPEAIGSLDTAIEQIDAA